MRRSPQVFQKFCLHLCHNHHLEDDSMTITLKTRNSSSNTVTWGVGVGGGGGGREGTEKEEECTVPKIHQNIKYYLISY